jgi:hypothetical protein
MHLVSIYSAAGLLEAHILKGFLEAQGLQVYINQESVGKTLGLSAGSLGMVDILVPDSQAAEASNLIDRIAAGEFENTEFADTSENSSDQ